MIIDLDDNKKKNYEREEKLIGFFLCAPNDLVEFSFQMEKSWIFIPIKNSSHSIQVCLFFQQNSFNEAHVKRRFSLKTSKVDYAYVWIEK